MQNEEQQTEAFNECMLSIRPLKEFHLRKRALELHYMPVAVATVAVRWLLAERNARPWEFLQGVSIVTGKGLHSKGQKAVVASRVRHMLKQFGVNSKPKQGIIMIP